MSLRTRTMWLAAALTLVAIGIPSTAPIAQAAPITEHQCQRARSNAAGKYANCDQKIAGVEYGGGGHNAERQFFACRNKYLFAWTKLHAKAIGGVSACTAERFVVSAGTVTDALTGLQWEQKTDDGSVHDKDDLYTWTAAGPSGAFSAADGTVFTSFLATLNGACFAGHCDWRLPTRAELAMLLLPEVYPCTSMPCIDQMFFGPTTAYLYWTSTTTATAAANAWMIGFDSGSVSATTKYPGQYARAVRGGGL